MRKIRADVLLEAGCVALVAALLFAIVFLAPDAGHLIGKSFFQVAFESSWRNPGDLPAAWCSLKILLLCAGAIMATEALSKVLEAFRQESLAITASFAALVPIMGLLLGFYELVKALL